MSDSVSSAILGGSYLPTEFHPRTEGRDHNETVRLWGMLCFAYYIDDVAWIDHTSDWDLAFEVTTNEGKVYASITLQPLMEDGTIFTKDNGVNELIHSVRITTGELLWTQNTDLDDTDTLEASIITIPLDSVEAIVYT